MNILPAHAGTGQWLYAHPSYSKWIRREDFERDHGILWITGKPGSGKSTLTKQAMLRTKELYGSSASVHAFFFNARGDALEKSEVGLYQALLGQVLKSHRHWPPEILEAFQKKLKVSQHPKWHPKELRGSLYAALLAQGRHPTYIFIDALDECEGERTTPNYESMNNVINFLEEVARSAANRSLLNICISRRHFPNIPDKPLQISMDGLNDADIEKYIQAKLRCPPEFEIESRETLIQRAAGVFLWVVLVVNSLNTTAYNPHTRSEVTSILKTLPEGLEAIFRRSFEKIPAQHVENSRRLIQWVLFARRPLSPTELTYAVACSIPHKSMKACELSPNFIGAEQMPQRVRFLSAGLVEVAQTSLKASYDNSLDDSFEETKGSRVQFIHESVRDWLLSDHIDLPMLEPILGAQDSKGPSHEMMKNSCINFLMFEELRTESTRYVQPGRYSEEVDDLIDPSRYLTKRKLAEDLKISFPLIDYAIRSIFVHAATAESQGIPQSSLGDMFLSSADNFFDVWASLNMYVVEFWRDRYSESGKSRKSAIPVLATLGLITCLTVLTENKVNVAAADVYSMTPLHLASENGHLCVVQLLLEGTIDIDAITYQEETPLMKATAKGHLEVVRLLLDHGAAVNAVATATTALTEALLHGHEEIATLLVQRGADVNIRGSGNPNIRGSEIYERCKCITPLQAAVDAGLGSMVRLLLTQGADVNAEHGRKKGRTLGRTVDDCHGSALVRAAKLGNIAILLALLNAGAYINDCAPTTPLQTAIQNNHPSIANLLLEKGAEVDAKGPDGTPLFIAARGAGDATALLQLLLNHGASIDLVPPPDDYPYREYETALHAAVLADNTNTVLFLLDNGAHVNPPSQKGRTVLEFAAKNGSHVMFDLLLGRGADIEELISPQSHCLSDAACHGSILIVRQLLELGLDINLPSSHGGPAIHGAARHGHDSLVRFLLENGADIEADGPDNDGTPLRAATDGGHIATVRVLLDNGANVNSCNPKRGTAITSAAYSNNIPIALLLLDAGADVNLFGEYGSPLSKATERASGEMVSLLLRHGAKVKVGPINALRMAVKEEREDAMYAILDSGADVSDSIAQGLVTAAQEGHNGVIGILLAHGANVNTAIPHSIGTSRSSSKGKEPKTLYMITPLSVAARSGRRSTMKLLLDHGAEPNLCGGVALQSTVRNDAAMSLLLRFGADINVVGGKYGTVLIAACAHKCEDLVKRLLGMNANPNGPMCEHYLPLMREKELERKGWHADAFPTGGKFGTALHAAVKAGVVNTVRLLLKHGGNPFANDDRYGNLLHACAISRNPITKLVEENQELVELLFAIGLDVNQLGGPYGTVLQSASRSGQTEYVRKLLERGADACVNQPESQCGTALHAAAAAGSIEIAQLLLDSGVDVNIPSGLHGTPILAAAAAQKSQMIEFLAENGAVMGGSGRHGTVLQNAMSADHAVREGRIEDIVLLILKHGANINETTTQFGTALHTACFKGFENVVGNLIEHGANVHILAGDFETALIAAAVGLSKPSWRDDTSPYKAIIKRLLEQGVNTNVRSAKYGTALDIAIAGGMFAYESKMLLIKHGAVKS